MRAAPGEMEAASASKDLLVSHTLRDSKCAECGLELPGTSLLYMDGPRPLCLACADLDHLAYLPSGDAALTRRARKRYERQGILVEEASLEQAEKECLEDAGQRARRSERDQSAARNGTASWRRA